MYGHKEVLAVLIGKIHASYSVINFFQAIISIFSDGQQIGWFAPTVPLLLSDDSPLKLTENNIGWLETFYFIGVAIGIPIIFFLVSAIGRKYSIVASSIINLLSWITTAFGTNFFLLCIAKFLAGIAGSIAFIAVPMYVAEIASKKIRGILLILVTASYYLGNVMIFAIAPFTSLNVPPLINVLFLLFQLSILTLLPESPYYLLLKKKSTLAEETLNRLRRTTNNTTELEEISAAVTRQQSERGRLVDLFLTKSNRKALFLVILSTSAPQFAGYCVITINVHQILLSAESAYYINPNISAVIFSIITLLAAVISLLFIDKFGRRLLVIVSCICCGISLFIIAIYFNLKSSDYKVKAFSWIPLAALIFYTIAFMFGLGSTKILTSELFSIKMKTIGAAITEILFLVFGLLTLKLYEELSYFGHQVSFYTFSLCSFIAAVLYAAFFPETKNKTLEEIQLMLRNQYQAVPTH